MNSLPENPTLKEINAYKRKLNWGESSTLYQMAASSASELDELMTHGFESGYKSILNKNNWNLKKLGGSKDEFGKITITSKPRVVLRHIYNEIGYELHCYPLVDGEVALLPLADSPDCPFTKWHPETMRRLFRVSNLPNFAIQTIQKGDEADYALIKHIYLRVQKLVALLKVHFTVEEIRGYTIAEFFKEVSKKHKKPDL